MELQLGACLVASGSMCSRLLGLLDPVYARGVRRNQPALCMPASCQRSRSLTRAVLQRQLTATVGA